jgi:hypothetical protein
VYRAIRAVVEEKISAEDGVERLRQCGERIQSLPSILADAFSVVGEFCVLEEFDRVRFSVSR